MHTDNHVIYVYLGIKDTRIEQIRKLPEMNQVLFNPNKVEPLLVFNIIITLQCVQPRAGPDIVTAAFRNSIGSIVSQRCVQCGITDI